MNEKIKSIIHSCNTIPQLETCVKFVEYIYINDQQAYIEALNEIQIRSEHLAICGIKSMTPELINEIHKMD
jgi:hypothetical protein